MTRSKPGSSGARFDSLVMMMRMPTVPGVDFHSAMTSATFGSSGSTGFTNANLSGWACCRRSGTSKRGRCRSRRRRRPCHCRHHFVAGDVGGPVRHPKPGPLRRVRCVGVDLRIDNHSGSWLARVPSCNASPAALSAAPARSTVRRTIRLSWKVGRLAISSASRFRTRTLLSREGAIKINPIITFRAYPGHHDRHSF
jgi:hypothetical protein